MHSGCPKNRTFGSTNGIPGKYNLFHSLITLHLTDLHPNNSMLSKDVDLKEFEIVNVCGELLVEFQIHLVDLKEALGEPNCT